MQPVIKPMWESKIDETEIPWLIAEKLAQRGFDNMLRYFKTIKDPETGKEPANEKEFALYCVKSTTQNLWDPAKYQGGDKFNGWEEFRKAGVWNSAPYPYPQALERHEDQDQEVRVLQRNPEGRAGGARQEAQHHGGRHPGGQRLPGAGRTGVRPPLRGAVDSRRREGNTPSCSWTTSRASTVKGGRPTAPGTRSSRTWTPAMRPGTMSPRSTRWMPTKLGLKNGDKIRITSPTGKLECTAKLWEGVRPGTVAKCYGQGHWVYGRVAAKVFGKEPRGGNNNEVLPAVYDRLSGATVRHAATRVKIEKI
ncbi:MAG: hypothetical protein MZV70_33275 [Desulfobacterales bacterium]|nr:hypothetical protein [Desulfobacterales bacterium]